AAALGDWTGGPPTSYFPAKDGQSSPRLEISERVTEQVHLCLGVPGLSNRHPDRFVLDLLNVILGEGMSSRLFLEIREKQGLAYDVHSQITHYMDTGAAMVYAGVDPRRAEDTIRAVLELLYAFKDQPVSAEEVTKAKEFTKGRLFLRMEDTRSVVGWMGSQELLLGQILTVDEVVEIIESITPEELQRVAQSLFVPERLSLAMVGPIKDAQAFSQILKL
ncbi:MAG TPA: pitrilysin family protein, partial [Dehalococcoidia bacterium]|nr:pitrilysin family protein [Dehalococcoidia bacterium]